MMAFGFGLTATRNLVAARRLNEASKAKYAGD
jgi:hypothetical protein